MVPIRPLALASNALGWAHSIRATGRLPLYQPDALTAPVRECDVAAVAVAALLGADGTSGLLTGPSPISQRHQVAAIATAAGRGIVVDELTREAALARFGRFMSQAEADAVVRFLDDAAAGNSPATNAVERILGRRPLGFEVWAADHVTDFVEFACLWAVSLTLAHRTAVARPVAARVGGDSGRRAWGMSRLGSW